MDRLMSLSVFVAAVEEGSIAAAGKRFGLSAVMAGRYLSALEERLCARLVQRTTRRLSLTDAGEAYFARSKRILDDLEEADDEAADWQAVLRGTLHITAPITFGSLYLGPVAARYMADFPEVNAFSAPARPIRGFGGRGHGSRDRRIGKLPDSDLVARKLADCQLMACASPNYLASAGTPVEPGRLQDARAHRLHRGRHNRTVDLCGPRRSRHGASMPVPLHGQQHGHDDRGHALRLRYRLWSDFRLRESSRGGETRSSPDLVYQSGLTAACDHPYGQARQRQDAVVHREAQAGLRKPSAMGPVVGRVTRLAIDRSEVDIRFLDAMEVHGRKLDGPALFNQCPRLEAQHELRRSTPPASDR